jgi:hypothetical protein
VTGALLAIAVWLDAIGFGHWARSARLVYPVANVVHLLGLVMLVGGIGVVDLRLAGLWRTMPLPPLARTLTPLAIAGLCALAASGPILFAADGVSLAASSMFHLKLVLIALALANAVAFRALWRRAPGGDIDGHMPTRLMAGGSLLLWLGVMTAGRMIAYT